MKQSQLMVDKFITKVAIRYENPKTGEVKLFSLSKPNRHHNLIHEATKNGWSRSEVLAADQGFMYMENTEKWCTRNTAFRIAAESGQIVNILDAPPGILFSEHFW